MRNRYENIIGVLFRAYAKSIIDGISKMPDVKDDEFKTITIGILQYRSFDNSFHYAPTLKSVFVRPTEIPHDKFPSSKENLWNYQLMISLAKYFYERRKTNWVEEIFEENEYLEEKKASILAFDDNFKNVRLEWKNWYKNCIDIFEEISEESDKEILDQLFYFANFLITIAKWPAHILKKPETLADFINTIINRHEYANYFNDDKFNKYTARLDNGVHIEWSSQPNSQPSGRIEKSELLYILEVCFKQPFNVDKKIEIINSITTNNEIEESINSCFFNGIARPIFASGEFLGITYITWTSNTRNESKVLYNQIYETIQNIFQDSRIANFLLKSKITATRFYLQNIHSDSDISVSPYKKLFDLTHILSSAHFVVYYEKEDLEFRFLNRKGNNHVCKVIERKKSKQDFINYLANILTDGDSSIFERPASWIDVTKKEICHSPDKENFYDEIKNDIEFFNERLKSYISDVDFEKHIYRSCRITNITCHNFEGADNGILFFNSNYFPIFNHERPTANLLKQSYAYDLSNTLNELIESERVSRDKYIQGRDSLRAMDMGLLHFLKSTLNKKFTRILDMDISDSPTTRIMKDNIERLEQQLNKYLTVYYVFSQEEKETVSNGEEKEVSINKIIETWNDKIKENSNIFNIFIEKCDLFREENNNKIKSSKTLFDMLFEELILNGIDRTRESLVSLSLNIEFDDKFVVFSIMNRGSTIPKDKRKKIGRILISDTRGRSGGFGYYIIQFLLRKMGAASSVDNPDLNFDIIYNDIDISFQLKFKILLV